MPTPPLADDYSLDDLDGRDYAESFDTYEPFGPLSALAAQAAEREYMGFPARESARRFEVRSQGDTDPNDIGFFPGKRHMVHKANSSCCVCRVELAAHPHLLQVHHPGRDRSTHDPKFMMLVCLDCHADMWGHRWMRGKHDSSVFELIRELRTAQGLPQPPKPNYRD